MHVKKLDVKKYVIAMWEVPVITRPVKASLSETKVMSCPYDLGARYSHGRADIVTQLSQSGGINTFILTAKVKGMTARCCKATGVDF